MKESKTKKMWWEIGSLTLLSLKELHLAIAVKSMSPNILYPTQSTDQQSWWGFKQRWKFQSMSNHEPCWPQTTGILEAFWPETSSKRRYTTNSTPSPALGTLEQPKLQYTDKKWTGLIGHTPFEPVLRHVEVFWSKLMWTLTPNTQIVQACLLQTK